MTQEERDCLKRVRDKNLTRRDAAEWCLLGLRDRASNRKLSDQASKQALTVGREPDWHDSEPTARPRSGAAAFGSDCLVQLMTDFLRPLRN